MSQRLEFIRTVVERRLPMRAVCRQFGISEKTGYKWLARFMHGGPDALADRSHAPLVPAHQVPADIRDRITGLREAHPLWGARKLRAVLAKRHPGLPWPAPSTITAVLKRGGHIAPRRRAPRDQAAWATGLTMPAAPNDVWTADFKGEFRLRSGPYCYPLTIADLRTRFLVGLRALPTTGAALAQAQFARCFRQYGLPAVLRTDNGGPFGAPNALGGLSALAVWLIRLGVRPERIRKGAPQENGAHERMHRTLKAEATRPPSASLEAQQRRFDRWRHEFNSDRPHEALGQTPPAAHYTTSPRAYPRALPELDYPARVDVRRVDQAGHIRWHSARVFLSHVLEGEYVGIEETGEAEWTITFGPLRLGHYREDTLAFVPALAWSPPPPCATLHSK